MGKHCNKMIAYNIPMSAMHQILKEMLYQNSNNCHSHLYCAMWNHYPKLGLKFNC